MQCNNGQGQDTFGSHWDMILVLTIWVFDSLRRESFETFVFWLFWFWDSWLIWVSIRMIMNLWNYESLWMNHWMISYHHSSLLYYDMFMNFMINHYDWIILTCATLTLRRCKLTNFIQASIFRLQASHLQGSSWWFMLEFQGVLLSSFLACIL